MGVFLIIGSILSVLYYWDPTRTHLKRWQESDPYKFETIDPKLASFRIDGHLSVQGYNDIALVRAKLISAIWGEDGFPSNKTPDSIGYNLVKNWAGDNPCSSKIIEHTRRQIRCELSLYDNSDNLKSLEELSVSIDEKYNASIAYFQPKTKNGTLVVYQHGYAGTCHDQYRILIRLIEEGYTAAALNHASYGDNACESKDNEHCHVAWGTFNVPRPMRMHFTPPVVAINHALIKGVIKHIVMIGLSAGGWVTTVTAAVDTRIDLSVPVAGVMPKALRRDNKWPAAQRYNSLNSAASFFDLFTLATDGKGRQQIQIFNQFDRCCYSGLRPRLYTEKMKAHVKAVTGGEFGVIIDSTHPRHKISRYALDLIANKLRDLGWEADLAGS